MGTFPQDSWKVNRKLTRIWVRWDLGQVAREQYGCSADFSPTLANANAAVTRAPPSMKPPATANSYRITSTALARVSA